MIVPYFMKFEPGLAKIINVICVFDMVTDLVIENACGIDEAILWIRHLMSLIYQYDLPDGR